MPRKQIEAALVQEDYTTAVAQAAEEGVQKFPQEQSLVKLKALAEGQRGRVEQKKFVREQFSAASSLAESGQLAQALAVLDAALRKVPRNSELETLRSTLRNRVAEEEAEQRSAVAALLMHPLPKRGGEFCKSRSAECQGIS